jgi:cytochrome c biogenesis protein
VNREAQASDVPAVKVIAKKGRESILDKLLSLLSSVRFGIVMLVILLICCMIGMLIMQKDVEGFMDYYQSLTPAQRVIWGKLGFFDIYHSLYFSILLAITGLNIILASIDRFPTAWQYVIKPRVSGSRNFIHAQMFNAEASVEEKPEVVASRIAVAWKNHAGVRSSMNGQRLGVLASFGVLVFFLFDLLERNFIFYTSLAVCLAIILVYIIRGLKFDVRATEETNRITVFGQLNVWNRLGAYIVHVGLLTIFVGGLLTAKLGTGGLMEITPGVEKAGSTYDTFEMTLDGPRMGKAQLPFKIECTDLKQRLIRPEGNLESSNTIDWLSYVRIVDAGYTKDVVVHLNNPVDYRGYRFFQSKFDPVGNARSITLSFEPVSGGPARRETIPRDGTVDVEGVGKVSYTGFYSDFEMRDEGPVNASPDYVNPVAQLVIVTPDGEKRGALAFNPEMFDRVFAGQQEVLEKGTGENPILVSGHKVLLRDFEKVGTAHILAVQYDPGRIPFYVGSTLLVGALCFVFFMSHQRVWAVIEPDGKGSKVHIGGNTNRNRPAFEARFNSLVECATGGRREK